MEIEVFWSDFFHFPHKYSLQWISFYQKLNNTIDTMKGLVVPSMVSAVIFSCA